ncbi:tumor necrosis factor alpha-induced protein 8 isoform X1 [Oryctolagus cuniculus]|uniref:tumor necrosis factor alpha-induced protein 8 isoform X1 n=1 Tax=Oryctolagus cuniculus TaxID=9986 RepID=UPI00387988BB
MRLVWAAGRAPSPPRRPRPPACALPQVASLPTAAGRRRESSLGRTFPWKSLHRAVPPAPPPAIWASFLPGRVRVWAAGPAWRAPEDRSAAGWPAAGDPDAMRSEAEEGKEVATDVFNSKNLAVQAQKKILGKMVSKSIATTLIDDTSSEVLDELYRVTREYTQSKKEAEKIIKDLIKTVIKLAILYRNNQFNQDELALMEKFKKKVHQLAMTVVSFHQVDYTFDRNVLSRLLNECRELLHQIIQRHLTAKSHGRVNNVFDHFSDCDFLAALYNPFGNFKPHLQKLCDGINKMLDEENI